MSEEPRLAKVRDALNQLLTELHAMKASICILLVYVEQELEKKQDD